MLTTPGMILTQVEVVAAVDGQFTNLAAGDDFGLLAASAS